MTLNSISKVTKSKKYILIVNNVMSDRFSISEAESQEYGNPFRTIQYTTETQEKIEPVQGESFESPIVSESQQYEQPEYEQPEYEQPEYEQPEYE
jgi:hypothetical protein